MGAKWKDWCPIWGGVVRVASLEEVIKEEPWRTVQRVGFSRPERKLGRVLGILMCPTP